MTASREDLVTAIDDLLREISRGYLKPSHAALKDLDATIGQIHCARTVGRLGNPTMSELADALRLHPSTVTPLVNALVERGLVERRDDPDDRRVVRVALTEKGKRKRAKHGAVRDRLRELTGDIADEDLRRIHAGLTILRDAAARKAKDRSTTAGDEVDGDRPVTSPMDTRG